MLTPEERLLRLERLLEELRLENSDGAVVIVEGKRDVAALRAIGCEGEVIPLHRGAPLFAFCERIAAAHDRVILLTDGDRKGGRLAESVERGLAANGRRAERRLRRELFRLTDGKEVESLASFVVRLREKVQRRPG